ncbi:MAG TPA: phosphoesterase [Pirellulales bacterium]|nr:phosphoesterase [Pirellulales bacterium]
MAVEAPKSDVPPPAPKAVDTAAEQILVVPTAVFHRLGHFQGFCPASEAERYLAELLKPEHISFRPRGEMEQDPGFKQLIPYCIFRHVSADGVESLFEYTRGTGQGEGRLHRKRSIGIGGHISSEDATGGDDDLYRTGMRRELAEEVIIDTPFCEHCVGLINDDESEVGRVHLGIVHLFDVGRPAIQPREDQLIACGFRPVAELLDDMTRFETWSSICLTALFGASAGT